MKKDPLVLSGIKPVTAVSESRGRVARGFQISNFKIIRIVLFRFVLRAASPVVLTRGRKWSSAENEFSNLKFKLVFPQKCRSSFDFPGVCPWYGRSLKLAMLLCWLLVAWGGLFPPRESMLALRGNLPGTCMQPN